MGDLNVLDPDRNPALLGMLRSDVVMVGLNLSRDRPAPFGNFHDAKAEGQDYKVRFAFTGTPFYGAYMTDIIKGVVMLKAGNLMRFLAANQHVVAESVERLLEEFDDLKSESPTVIAFGGGDRRSRVDFHDRVIALLHDAPLHEHGPATLRRQQHHDGACPGQTVAQEASRWAVAKCSCGAGPIAPSHPATTTSPNPGRALSSSASRA